MNEVQQNLTIQECNLHDHTYMTYTNQNEFFHCAIPFLNEGIKKNEKCLIVIDLIKREDVLRNFKFLFRDGINPFEEMGHSKRIQIEQFKDIYLVGGSFIPTKTLEIYLAFLNNAILEAYKGLRVFAEISSSTKKYIPAEDFLNWEEEANNHFDNKFLAVCAYDSNYFDSSFLTSVNKRHPIKINVLK